MSQLPEDQNLYRKIACFVVVCFRAYLEMFTVLRCSGSSQRGMRTRGSLHFLARANCGHIFRRSSFLPVSMHHVYASVVRVKFIIH